MATKTERLQSVVARLDCDPSLESLGRGWTLVASPRDLHPVSLFCGAGRTGLWRDDM